ncbi:MAG: TetR/AcrR family transcriptional regulator [Gammaproteobacteria bacterium]|nr:MAG: TetR/AcrR family transcriptional regulator [Gammaproteobacteria bacterium]
MTQVRQSQKPLSPRNRPAQQRSLERRQQILDTTAALLERVGFDDLTTILVAKELGISVGTLYHYYPNKQAILHALGVSWLEEMLAALQDIASWEVENLSVKVVVDRAIERLAEVYRNQRGLLPLVQALWAVPELRKLDEEHDSLVLGQMSSLFQRMEISADKGELNRLAKVFLELTHALLLMAVNQSASPARQSLADLKFLVYSLLNKHREAF